MDFGSAAEIVKYGSQSGGSVNPGIIQAVIGGVQAAQQDHWNRMNFGLGLGTQIYNMSLNKRLMRREDNAVQRRVADLERAGLHPMLAAGSPAQSHPSAPVESASRAHSQLDLAAMAGAIMRNNAEIDKTKAEAANIRRQTRRLDSVEDLDRVRASHLETEIDNLLKIYDQLDHNLSVARRRNQGVGESSQFIQQIEAVQRAILTQIRSGAAALEKVPVIGSHGANLLRRAESLLQGIYDRK